MFELLQLVVPAVLLAIGFVFGRRAELRHYASILQREDELRDLVIVQSRFPPPMEPAPQSTLVGGGVVISVDYFKVFVANLRTLFGGRLVSYESLVDRARRESVLRMKEEARALGATTIVNVKFETVPLYKGRRGSIQSVESYAYGTALIPSASPR